MISRLHPSRPAPGLPLSSFSPSMLACFLPCLPFPSSRDEKFVTATPLDSALTNCDVGKSFRIRSYANCRVSLCRQHCCARYDKRCSATPLECAVPKNIGGRPPHLLCRHSVSPGFRRFFQVRYALSPLFVTLTKTAGVCLLSSQSGTLREAFVAMGFHRLREGERAIYANGESGKLGRGWQGVEHSQEWLCY